MTLDEFVTELRKRLEETKRYNYNKISEGDEYEKGMHYGAYAASRSALYDIIFILEEHHVPNPEY